MSAQPMNREQLLTFIRNNYSAEDIWPDDLIFDSSWEVEDYMSGHGWHSQDDCEWEGPASDNGWGPLNDPACVANAADEMGLTFRPDLATLEFEHDTQGHIGAIAYCTTGLCSANH